MRRRTPSAQQGPCWHDRARIQASPPGAAGPVTSIFVVLKEKIAFRAQNLLAGRFGRLAAIAVAALLFTAYHVGVIPLLLFAYGQVLPYWAGLLLLVLAFVWSQFMAAPGACCRVAARGSDPVHECQAGDREPVMPAGVSRFPVSYPALSRC